MKKPALAVLQDTYQLVINSKGSYYEQLQPLAPSGHLSNKSLLLKVIFDLCEVIDKQEGRIEALENDRLAIAKQMAELEKQTKTPLNTPTDTTQPLDPTKPLPAV